MDDQPHEKIVFVRESTESTGDHHYADTSTVQPVILDEPDRTPLAVISLILALPFPITIITLWVTFNAIKGQAQSFSNVTMNAVFLYLFQFFVIPVLTIGAVWLAYIVISKSRGRAKKLAIASLGLTVIGFILMALFLQLTK